MIDCINEMYNLMMKEKEEKNPTQQNTKLSDDDVHRVAEEVVAKLQKPQNPDNASEPQNQDNASEPQNPDNASEPQNQE